MKEWRVYYKTTLLRWTLDENLDNVTSKFFQQFPEWRDKDVRFEGPFDPKERYEDTLKKLKIWNNAIHKGTWAKTLQHRKYLEGNMQYYEKKGYCLQMESC